MLHFIRAMARLALMSPLFLIAGKKQLIGFLWREERMALAERCLYYALIIAPKGHPDRTTLATHLLAWGKENGVTVKNGKVSSDPVAVRWYYLNGVQRMRALLSHPGKR